MSNPSRTMAATKNNMPLVMVRTESAGVHYGYKKSVENTVSGRIIVLEEARRVWYWAGAATLSQLAIDGSSKPTDCKFPEAVPENEISGVIEIIPMTEKAKKSLDTVPIWAA